MNNYVTTSTKTLSGSDCLNKSFLVKSHTNPKHLFVSYSGFDFSN